MPKQDRRRVDVFGLLAFAAVVALALLVDLSTGLRAFGAWMVVTAIVQQVTGRLPINWEGEPPSRATMTVLNSVVGLVGAVVLVWPDVVIATFFR